MKKIFLSLLFALTVFCSLIFTSSSASAYTHYEDVDGWYCYVYFDADTVSSTATITEMSESGGKVIIPETVEAYIDEADEEQSFTVVRIRKSEYAEHFNYIQIPKTVTEIEPFAVGYVEEYDYETDEYVTEKIEGFTVGCVKGSYAEAYAAENGFAVSYIKDISELSVVLSGNTFTYNFNEIEPEVTITDGDKVLVCDTDYYLEYENNYSVGTATVTVTGKGNYVGSRVLSYTISPIDVSMLTFSEVEDREFDGSYYEPYVSITYGDQYLYEDSDYTVTYKNNRLPGTASVIFVFKGSYTGTKTINFKIYIPEITELTATATTPTNITLSWKCDSWNIEYYNVYRYNTKKKNYVKIGTSTYGSYYDEKLKADTEYKYKVVPVIKDGKKEVQGTEAFTSCRTLMNSPKVELTLLNGSVKIKYTKVSGADGYIIYRTRWDKFCEQEEIKTIKKSKSGSYTDKAINSNGEYKYTVAAYKNVNGEKILGEKSNGKFTTDPEAILRGAVLKQKTSFPVYNTQGATTTSYIYNLTANDVNIVKSFAKKHFKKNWSDVKKLQYTLNWINTKVLYARGENWNKIAGKTWVDAIYTYKMGQCAQYNGAMAAMLVYLGYDASIIKGYRGSGTQHFWCEVKIRGRTYVMETGNYSSSGSWSYFLEPYSNTFGYVKNGSAVVTPLLEPDVKSITLSKTRYDYDGKTKKPSVKVINTQNKALKEGKDYTVEYEKGRKNYGTYEVTVTLKGKYTGKEILYFDITPKTPVLKLTAGKKSFTASWDKVKNADGYEIVYSTDKSFPWDKTYSYTVHENTDGIKIKSLKKKKKYYVKVRAFVNSDTDDGYYYTGCYSDYSKVKSIKTK